MLHAKLQIDAADTESTSKARRGSVDAAANHQRRGQTPTGCGAIFRRIDQPQALTNSNVNVIACYCPPSFWLQQGPLTLISHRPSCSRSCSSSQLAWKHTSKYQRLCNSLCLHVRSRLVCSELRSFVSISACNWQM